MWSAAAAFAMSAIGLLALLKPRVSPDASERFRVGRPEEFPPGSARSFPEKKVQIVSTEEGLGAISLVCTHLGCLVAESEEGFRCPCHGSRFDHQGKVLAGPAPRPLPWFALSEVADGTLVVDATREVETGTMYKTLG